jgi:hypothetical protein
MLYHIQAHTGERGWPHVIRPLKTHVVLSALNNTCGSHTTSHAVPPQTRHAVPHNPHMPFRLLSSPPSPVLDYSDARPISALNGSTLYISLSTSPLRFQMPLGIMAPSRSLWGLFATYLRRPFVALCTIIPSIRSSPSLSSLQTNPRISTARCRARQRTKQPGSLKPENP